MGESAVYVKLDAEGSGGPENRSHGKPDLEPAIQPLPHVLQDVGVSIAASLALFIACLGLFALTAFTVEQRTKEIGIRKVLGASTASIVTLLSKEFIKLIVVANFVAWPVAYIAMNAWLQHYAYRIQLGPGIFMLSGLLALCIALSTIGYQAIKAARANPIDSLRYE